MGLIAEVSNACVYEELQKVLKMINDNKSKEEIKNHIKNIMNKCAEEMEDMEEVESKSIYERLAELKKKERNYHIQENEIEALSKLLEIGRATVDSDDTAMNLIKGLKQMRIRFMVVSMSEFSKNWYFEIMNVY